jgi:hypothetical protein
VLAWENKEDEAEPEAGSPEHEQRWRGGMMAAEDDCGSFMMGGH